MSMATELFSPGVEGYNDPELVEAMACREGLALASDLGLHSFRVASDCGNMEELHGQGVRQVWTRSLGDQ
jgi:hypothetical protein